MVGARARRLRLLAHGARARVADHADEGRDAARARSLRRPADRDAGERRHPGERGRHREDPDRRESLQPPARGPRGGPRRRSHHRRRDHGDLHHRQLRAAWRRLRVRKSVVARRSGHGSALRRRHRRQPAHAGRAAPVAHHARSAESVGCRAGALLAAGPRGSGGDPAAAAALRRHPAQPLRLGRRPAHPVGVRPDLQSGPAARRIPLDHRRRRDAHRVSDHLRQSRDVRGGAAQRPRPLLRAE